MPRRYSEADLQSMIALYLDGALDEAERAAVEAWFAEHPEAMAEFAAASRLIDLLDEAVTAPPVDDRFTGEVMARCRTLSPSARWRLRLGFVQPLTVLRWLAEGMLLALLVVLLVLHPWAPTINPVECRLLGSDIWDLTRPAAVRVLVTRRADGQPLVNAEVRLRLHQQRRRQLVCRGMTNDQGTLAATVDLAGLAPGRYALLAEATAANGRATVGQRITLVEPPRLALHPTADRLPVGGRLQAALTVLDGAGRPRRETVDWRLADAFDRELAGGQLAVGATGRAVFNIPLAETLAPGPATLWLTAGGARLRRTFQIIPATGELRVRLKGVPATVEAGRRFDGVVEVRDDGGQPLERARVRLTDGATGALLAEGATDPAGLWPCRLALPAPVGVRILRVTASDGWRAGSSEVAPRVVTGPLRLRLEPVGQLVAGLTARVPVRVEWLDGRPYTGRVTVRFGREPVTLAVRDGAGRVDLKPATAGRLPVELTATVAGRRATKRAWIDVLATAEGLLVTPEPARIPPAGEVRLSVRAPEPVGAVYVDLIQAGQVIGAASLGLPRGEGSLVVRLPETVRGEVLLRAYARGSTGWRTGLARLTVDPPTGLPIELTPDAEQPGVVQLASVDAAPSETTFLVARTEPPLADEVEPGPLIWPRPRLAASSSEAARRRALTAQREFFHQSPLYGGVVCFLLLAVVFLWLYQQQTDPFEVVRRPERGRWGPEPRVHRRGAWAGLGVLLLGLTLAVVVSGGLLLAGRQARELALEAGAPARGWRPPEPPPSRLAGESIERLAAAASEPTPRAFAPAAWLQPITVGDDREAVALPPAPEQVWWLQALTPGLAATPAVRVAAPAAPAFTCFPPTRLTVGSSVTLPVALTNPTDELTLVEVTVTTTGGLSAEVAPRQVVVPARGRIELAMPLRAVGPGRGRLTLTALGRGLELRHEAELELDLPDAVREATGRSGPLHEELSLPLERPADATAGLVEVVVDPEPLRAWDEALAAGAAEPPSTISEVLARIEVTALRWSLQRQTGRASAETLAALEHAARRAAQGLLAHDVIDRGRPTGGFADRPGEPATKLLTARALLALERLGRLTRVDPALVARARGWLLARYHPHRPGWLPDQEIPGDEFATEQRARSVTAVVATALAATGGGPETTRVVTELVRTAGAATDNDALTWLVTAAGAGGHWDRAGLEAATRLAALRYRRDDGANWYPGPAPTLTGATGRGAAVETTARAVAALAATGDEGHLLAAREGAAFLERQQLPDGTWGSAALTARVIEALAAVRPERSPARGTVTLLLDGEPLKTFDLTGPDSERRFHFEPPGGSHTLTLRPEGRGQPSARLTVEYLRGGSARSAGGLAVTATLASARLAPGEQTTLTLAVRNPGLVPLAGVVARWPVPAGCAARLDPASPAARDLLLIPVGRLAPGELRRVTFRLRAEAPAADVTPAPIEVRSLYDPGRRATARLPRLRIS